MWSSVVIVVLTWVSLIANDVEHLFTFASHLYIFGKEMSSVTFNFTVELLEFFVCSRSKSLIRFSKVSLIPWLIFPLSWWTPWRMISNSLFWSVSNMGLLETKLMHRYFWNVIPGSRSERQGDWIREGGRQQTVMNQLLVWVTDTWTLLELSEGHYKNVFQICSFTGQSIRWLRHPFPFIHLSRVFPRTCTSGMCMKYPKLVSDDTRAACWLSPVAASMGYFL